MKQYQFVNYKVCLPDDWPLVDPVIGILDDKQPLNSFLNYIGVFEIRNGDLFNVVNRVAVLLNVPVNDLTREQIDKLTENIVRHVPEWDPIRTLEVHADGQDYPFHFYDNFKRRRTITEWIAAPEILLYTLPIGDESYEKRYDYRIEPVSDEPSSILS